MTKEQVAEKLFSYMIDLISGEWACDCCGGDLPENYWMRTEFCPPGNEPGKRFRYCQFCEREAEELLLYSNRRRIDIKDTNIFYTKEFVLQHAFGQTPEFILRHDRDYPDWGHDFEGDDFEDYLDSIDRKYI